MHQRYVFEDSKKQLTSLTPVPHSGLAVRMDDGGQVPAAGQLPRLCEEDAAIRAHHRLGLEDVRRGLPRAQLGKGLLDVNVQDTGTISWQQENLFLDHWLI